MRFKFFGGSIEDLVDTEIRFTFFLNNGRKYRNNVNYVTSYVTSLE
jgi:hypothetical protein